MMHRRIPHLLLAVCLVVVGFTATIHTARASVSDYIDGIFTNDAVTQNNKAVMKESPSKNKHDIEGMSNFMSGGLTFVAGAAAIRNDGSLSSDEMRKIKKELGYGALGDVNQGIIALYNPPASARTYVADLMKSARVIPEAQAQGLGFSALDPILETWKTFRNLAYLFFVVAFLAIGFMIMFRTKVGQAAITAQQAIPSIIVAMLAVTFSYAIAGLMIDLMYVIMYMIAGFFTEGADVINKNMWGLVGMMFQGTSGVQEALEQFMEDALNIGWLGDAFAWLSSLLGSVIIGVAVLFASFKVFFELVKTYVAVLIQIIFSPIILMFGAIPGQNTFGKWIKDLAGNLVLWPVVLLCILVQRLLTAPIRSLQGLGNSVSGPAINNAFGGGFMPPFLVGQGQGAILPVLVGLGVLLVIPEIMQQVKKAMGVSEGVFGELAKSAMNQIKSSTIVAPLATSAISGTASGIRAGAAYMKDQDGDYTAANVLKKAWTGYTRKGDPNTPDAHFGGFTGSETKDNMPGGLKKGFDTGQQLRIYLDRLAEGRAFDPEDMTKMLGEYINKNQKK